LRIDSKSHEFLLPERPRASNLARYFLPPVNRITAMPRANEIKKGMVLNYNGKLLIVKDIDIQAPAPVVQQRCTKCVSPMCVPA
jgi:hypothetical protein